MNDTKANNMYKQLFSAGQNLRPSHCRYAELRRRLLVDPHIMEESQKGSDLSMDNPLSQNPGGLRYDIKRM